MPDLKEIIPSALRENARWVRIGPDEAIPAMLVHPTWDHAQPAPIVIWMHGRTVTKETDPGRYLRWMRAGIGACAVDLPGHGERFDQALQSPDAAWTVMVQMFHEIDDVVQSLRDLRGFDLSRIAIGGMSLGGMAALARLAQPHPFRCASVEATTGSWGHQRERAMFRHAPQDEVRALEPMLHLDGWREIPLQAIHTRADEWVAYEGQAAFIEALRAHYADPALIEFIAYDRTGAPQEHAGFGRRAADAKTRQTAFFQRWLASQPR